MSDIRTPLLQGDDRIEMWPEAGRPIRMGSPKELEIGDTVRIQQAIEGGDSAQARDRLDYFLSGAIPMIGIYTELVLALVAEASSHGSDDDLAWKIWLEEADEPLLASPLRKIFEEAVGPGRVDPASADRFRQAAAGGQPTAATPLIAVLRAHHEAAVEALGSTAQEAGAAAERFTSTYRTIHDMLSLLASAHGAAALEQWGQDVALDIQQRAFQHSTFFEPMWQSAGTLPPDMLAAVLADHLRFHMSGPERSAAVRIVEEDDRYRLILDVCGSGGVMRRTAARRGTRGGGSLPDAAPLTWGRRNEVPVYCSHCALNEVESIRRFGYPISVTEFDPDPARPCGWTVYKDPARIPDRYRMRLAAPRDVEGHGDTITADLEKKSKG